jgi:hypothetical protein
MLTTTRTIPVKYNKYRNASKVTVMASLKVLFWYFPSESKGNHERPTATRPNFERTKSRMLYSSTLGMHAAGSSNTLV